MRGIEEVERTVDTGARGQSRDCCKSICDVAVGSLRVTILLCQLAVSSAAEDEDEEEGQQRTGAITR